MEVNFTTSSFSHAAFLAAVARGLNQGALKVAGDAKPLTPNLDGDLERSQAVHEATANSLTAAVSYDTDYAVRQHEEMDYNHTTDPNPAAQAKYLEEPFMTDRSDAMGLIQACAREGLT